MCLCVCVSVWLYSEYIKKLRTDFGKRRSIDQILVMIWIRNFKGFLFTIENTTCIDSRVKHDNCQRRFKLSECFLIFKFASVLSSTSWYEWNRISLSLILFILFVNTVTIRYNTSLLTADEYQLRRHRSLSLLCPLYTFYPRRMRVYTWIYFRRHDIGCWLRGNSGDLQPCQVHAITSKLSSCRSNNRLVEICLSLMDRVHHVGCRLKY